MAQVEALLAAMRASQSPIPSVSPVQVEPTPAIPNRKRGRPPGSKNKPKTTQEIQRVIPSAAIPETPVKVLPSGFKVQSGSIELSTYCNPAKGTLGLRVATVNARGFHTSSALFFGQAISDLIAAVSSHAEQLRQLERDSIKAYETRNK
jgi:hypothetical protein